MEKGSARKMYRRKERNGNKLSEKVERKNGESIWNKQVD